MLILWSNGTNVCFHVERCKHKETLGVVHYTGFVIECLYSPAKKFTDMQPKKDGLPKKDTPPKKEKAGKEASKPQEKKEKKKKEEKEAAPAEEEMDECEAALASEPKTKDPFAHLPKRYIIFPHASDLRVILAKLD